MKRSWLLLVVSVVLVGAFYVLGEHWGHALGLAPYLLLLACPLLHLFGHGGHGHGHGGEPPPRSDGQ